MYTCCQEEKGRELRDGGRDIAREGEEGKEGMRRRRRKRRSISRILHARGAIPDKIGSDAGRREGEREGDGERHGGEEGGEGGW